MVQLSSIKRVKAGLHRKVINLSNKSTMNLSTHKARLLKGFTLVLTVFAITACANTKPVGEWSNESFTGKLNNILVIGVTSKSDRRRDFEDQFVAGLAAIEVNATPSHTLIESSLYLSRQVVESAIEGQDIGGVLITRLASFKDNDVYRPVGDQKEYLSYFNFNDNTWKQSEGGTYEERQIVTLETNLYDTSSGDLVWSMQSEIVDVSKSHEVLKEQIELTISTLANRGLIGAGS